MSVVLIIDHHDGHRMEMSIGPDDHLRIDPVWDEKDKLLVGLQTNSFFHGRTRWCDLDPWHYTILIEKNLSMVADLSVSERHNPLNLIMISLSDLLACMIRCIEARGQCTIDLLRIIRIPNTGLTYDYTASMNHAVVPSPRSAGLKIVVDNG